MLRGSASLIRQLPSSLLEIAHQHLHRQAALHLELRVQAFPRAAELVARDVGADDFDPPVADQLARHSARIIASE